MEKQICAKVEPLCGQLWLNPQIRILAQIIPLKSEMLRCKIVHLIRMLFNIFAITCTCQDFKIKLLLSCNQMILVKRQKVLTCQIILKRGFAYFFWCEWTLHKVQKEVQSRTSYHYEVTNLSLLSWPIMVKCNQMVWIGFTWWQFFSLVIEKCRTCNL